MGIQFLPFQGYGGTQVPYERRNAPQNTFALSPADSRRLKRYEEHWRFYQGIQWGFQREDGEALVTVNYCKKIVDKKAAWLVGKGMSLDVPEALIEITKPVLEEVWKYNEEQRFLNEAAVSGGVTGDVFVMVTPQYPDAAQLAINPHTQGKIRIQLLNPHTVFPVWDTLDKNKLLSVRIVTEVIDSKAVLAQQVQQSAMGMDARLRGPTPSQPAMLDIMQKRRYIQTLTPEYIDEGWEGESITRKPNPLGEIPLVHIPNESVPNEYYGMSDLDSIIDVQREFNEKMTDLSDIVNYHASPVTVITGAKAKQLEKGPKALWTGLPSDARVQTLQLAGDLGMSHKYLELVRQVMLDLSGVPEQSLGREQAVSNTAAAALAIQFQPLEEVRERKAPNYEHGIEQINYLILRYHQLMTGMQLPVNLCEHCGGRIVEFAVTGADGTRSIRRKCYLIDPETLDFMDPDNVEVTIKREHSFGVETRKMRYGDIRKMWGKKHTSYWDPEKAIDKQEEADTHKEHAEKKAEEAKAEAEEAQKKSADQNAAAQDVAHQRNLELKTAGQAPPKPAAPPAKKKEKP